MQQHTLNRIGLVSATVAIFGLGLALGIAVANSMPPTDTVRILKIGAALEQSGAMSHHFEHVGALIDSGRMDEATAVAEQRRGQ
jgi:hypothetical protein